MPNQFKGGFQTQNREIVIEKFVVEGQIPKWLIGVFDPHRAGAV